LIISTASIFVAVHVQVTIPWVRVKTTFPLAGAYAEIAYPGMLKDHTDESLGSGVAVNVNALPTDRLGKVTVMVKG
jgi:hypothetical protein